MRDKEKTMRIMASLLLCVAVIGLAACGYAFGEFQVGVLKPTEDSTGPRPGTKGEKLPSATEEPADETKTPDATVAAPPAPIALKQVWLPYAIGAFGDPPSYWVVRPGMVAREQSPVPIQLFWDYSALTDRIAYSPNFWHASEVGSTSVSDLHVYDGNAGEDEEWWPDNVARAAWSPTIGHDGVQLLAVTLYDNPSASFKLTLMSGPGDLWPLAEEASFRFAWSPDGKRIAFVRPADSDSPQSNPGLYVVDIPDGEPVLVGSGNYGGGWIGDKPTWIEDRALMTAGEPLRITLLDGSDDFYPSTPQLDDRQGSYIATLLWSPSQNQAVVEHGEGLHFPSSVWVYALSQDLRTILESYQITLDGEDALWRSDQLVGWYTPGESVIVLMGDRPFLWSLPDRVFLPLQ